MGLGLKARLEGLRNRCQARLGFGDYWYWLDTEEVPAEIPIAPMVDPLRYDILVRKSFFDFCNARRDQIESDRAGFLQDALDHPYFLWFTEVLVARYHSADRNDPQRIRQLYHERVRQAVLLFDSIAQHGFSMRHPIIPYTGEAILPATSGREVTGRFFMGDGCHRLACLMSRGYTSLPREFVRVKCFRRLAPFDNSALLADHLPVDWTAFRSEGSGSGMP